MRIIAGTWRGRQLAAPRGTATRPILDRAKTVLFDMLGHRLAEPGRLPPVAVLDLYAGSGSLGLEALSRGARYCRFVERSPATAALLRRNLDALEIIDQAEVVEADAGAWEFVVPPTEADAAGTYGLVFVDPPYRLLTGPRPDGRLRSLLRRLTAPPVAPDAIIAVRQPLQPHGRPDLSPLVELERRDVGHMTLRFCAPAEPPPSAVDEEARWADV